MENVNNLAQNPDIEMMEDITPQRAQNNKKKKKGGKKKKRIIIAIIILLLLIVLAAGALILWYLYNWVGEEFDLMNHVNIDKKELCINEEADKNLSDYRNVLILGIDKRKGEDIEICRSDAMIMASIHKKTGKVKMVSIVRDSYLQLDEQGELIIDKLTHAHAYGGPKNTIRALNRNLDLNITEFIRIDWQTVADTVDSLGGLELEVHKSEIKQLNKYIKDTNESLEGDTTKIKKPGKQVLNGVQTVAYCRIRKSDGDAQRASRYRTALVAAIDKLRAAGPKAIDKTADTVLPQITTNISSEDLRDMLIKYYDMQIDESVGWPYTWDGALINGIWYDVPITLISNNEDLYTDVFEKKVYEPSDTVKEIHDQIIVETGYDENQPAQITNKE